MALSKREVVKQAQTLLDWRRQDRTRLDRLWEYIHNKQRFQWLPASPPSEVRRIADMSRVNVLGLVIDSVAQSMYVDGYRAPRQETESPAWSIWQQNGMDARQLGVHRAAVGYGLSYAVVLPGDPVPVIRGVSPRDMTAIYGEDDDWPVWALERRRSAVAGAALSRLFDEDMAYWISADATTQAVEFVSSEVHGVGHVPVVRFLAKSDLDDNVTSGCEDIIPLQGQVNLSTFGLLVSQH